MKNGSLSGLADKVAALGEESVAQQIGVGVPTLQDIVKELLKPGRDPRDELPPPLLRTDILELKDLKPGMGAYRHGTQRDRFRRLCGYRRAPGRAGTHLSNLQ